MKKIFFATLSLVAGLSFLSSCNEEDIMFYEGGNAVHFVDKERSMTFVTQPESVTAVLEVPVQLVGNIPEKDLTFSVEVVEDEEKITATPDQYQIGDCIVPAGKTEGTFKLTVKNPDMLDIDEKTLRLRVKLVDNETVKAGGWRDYLVIDLTWSSDYVKPATWTGFYYYVCQKYSPNMHRAYIAATGYTEFYNSLGKLVDPETGAYWPSDKQYAIAKKFGDWIRKWNEDNAPLVYCHDGDYKYTGEPIVPIW